MIISKVKELMVNLLYFECGSQSTLLQTKNSCSFKLIYGVKYGQIGNTSASIPCVVNFEANHTSHKEVFTGEYEKPQYHDLVTFKS